MFKSRISRFLFSFLFGFSSLSYSLDLLDSKIVKEFHTHEKPIYLILNENKEPKDKTLETIENYLDLDISIGNNISLYSDYPEIGLDYDEKIKLGKDIDLELNSTYSYDITDLLTQPSLSLSVGINFELPHNSSLYFCSNIFDYDLSNGVGKVMFDLGFKKKY